MKKIVKFALAIVTVISIGLGGPLVAQGLELGSHSKLPGSATLGSFKYTFSSIDCKKTKLGSGYLTTKADGVFCIVSTTAKNISSKSDYIGDSDIYLIDSQGNQFEHDSGTSMYLDGAFFLDKVSPGNQKKGFLVYDVPKSTKAVKILLDGGLFGTTSEVSLLATPSPSPSASSKSTAGSIKMPNLVGKILSGAEVQLKNLGSKNVTAKDATTKDRMVLLSTNWKVCKQVPAANAGINSSTAVTLWSVKVSEACP